jgi:uncharacterized protein (TIGR02246 family)
VDDRDAVLAAAGQRAAALVARDAEALRDLMHDDLRWTTYRGVVLHLDDYIRGNTGGSLHWHGQELVGPDVVVHGDTAVLTAVVVDDVLTEEGRQVFRLRLTQTWVREDGRWRCLSGHAGPRLEEPSP